MDSDRTVRARLRDRGQVTLPPEVRSALRINEGDEIAFEVTDHGVVMRGLTTIPSDQAWFWQAGWQAGERQASADVADGRVTTFGSADDFLDSLD